LGNSASVPVNNRIEIELRGEPDQRRVVTNAQEKRRSIDVSGGRSIFVWQHLADAFEVAQPMNIAESFPAHGTVRHVDTNTLEFDSEGRSLRAEVEARWNLRGCRIL
jgi:hypothetical protein